MNKYIVGSILILVTVGAFFGFNYLASLQKVTLHFDASQGLVSLSGDHIQGSINITPNKEITLQKGTYHIHIHGDNAKQETRDLNVQDSPVIQTIVINLPDKKLDQLRDEQFETIKQVITKNYPTLESLYIINPGKLYARGEWYGTTLTYKGTDKDNRDTLRLVMHKEAGQWKLLSIPPKLLLSIVEYPSVPKDILDDINKPAYLPGTDVSPAIYPN